MNNTYNMLNFINSAPKHKVQTEQQAQSERDSRNAETDLQNLICQWMSEAYPNLVFISDFAAGLKLSPFLAAIRKKQSCEYKVPDLYIFGPVKPLIIEIKTDIATVFLKDGKTLASEHLQRQYETIKILRNTCYADFGIGEDDIKQVIKMYMAGNVFIYKDVIDNQTHLSSIYT